MRIRRQNPYMRHGYERPCNHLKLPAKAGIDGF